MNLQELSLRSFRNYGEVSLEFEPGVNLIVGDNAQGKTNLLEAISYLGTGKSFRAQKTSEMIRFGDDFAEIKGKVFPRSGSRNYGICCLQAAVPGRFSGTEPRKSLFRNWLACCPRCCSARRIC